MKKDLKAFLAELDENELEAALVGFKADSLSELEAERIRKNACRRAGIGGDNKQAKRSLHVSRRAVIALAACAALLAVLSFATFAIAEEAREYNEAVAFCIENDIPTEGMTRSEIKEVYRSFKTGSRSYIKGGLDFSGEPQYAESTAEVGGISFEAETTEPAEPKEYHPDFTSIGCYRWEPNDDGGETCLSYYVGEELIWSYTTDEIIMSWAEPIEGGAILAGRTPDSHTPAVIKLNENGEYQWLRTLGEGDISLASVIGGGDGSVTVFISDEDYASGVNNKLTVTKIDAEGNIVYSTVTTSPDPIRVGKAVHYGDGYIAITHIDEFAEGGRWNVQRLARIDGEGRLLGELSYSADGVDYNLYDVMVYGDKLYINAYARDNSVFGPLYGDEYWANAQVSDEEFTQMVKEACTAVLLVCDADGGELKTFCEVKGAYGLELIKDEDGFLAWQVNSVYSAKYAPGENSMYINAKVKMLTYRFDLDGTFVDKTDSGEVTDF